MRHVVRGERVWMQDECAPDPEPVSEAFERLFGYEYDPSAGIEFDEGDCAGTFFRDSRHGNIYVVNVHGSYYEIYTGCKLGGVV